VPSRPTCRSRLPCEEGDSGSSPATVVASLPGKRRRSHVPSIGGAPPAVEMEQWISAIFGGQGVWLASEFSDHVTSVDMNGYRFLERWFASPWCCRGFLVPFVVSSAPPLS